MVGFKGYCNYCGKYGHKKMFCEEAKKNGDAQQPRGGNQGQHCGFNVTYNYCEKRGLKAHQCWNNPNNPNNRRNGTDGQNTRDEETEEIADVVFTATEVVKGTPKKYYWYDWNKESDDKEDEILKRLSLKACRNLTLST